MEAFERKWRIRLNRDLIVEALKSQEQESGIEEGRWLTFHITEHLCAQDSEETDLNRPEGVCWA